LNPCTSDTPEPRKALLTTRLLRDNRGKFHWLQARRALLVLDLLRAKESSSHSGESLCPGKSFCISTTKRTHCVLH